MSNIPRCSGVAVSMRLAHGHRGFGRVAWLAQNFDADGFEARTSSASLAQKRARVRCRCSQTRPCAIGNRGRLRFRSPLPASPLGRNRRSVSRDAGRGLATHPGAHALAEAGVRARRRRVPGRWHEDEVGSGTVAEFLAAELAVGDHREFRAAARGADGDRRAWPSTGRASS